ncbi:SIMPL domain-containing protein [Aurantibacillus circumpalustris]|uniref:SIMPL domain-containing protein n=1 Tax=Aurantibacillus circumpalustris TaxID=3036359 RepID=UPI00295A912A|nr:SIMPL domain-containing protein [Aurantibacillus circumpalustris]
MNTKTEYIKSISIIIAFVVSAIILGNAIQRFKNEDRYISVKGFSEKEVKADLVIWTIKIRVADNELIKGNSNLESLKAKVTDFLVTKGVAKTEINSLDILVIDNQANEYNANITNRMRYIIEETIEVRSNNVELIQKISRMTNELLNAGVALSTKSDWRGSGLQFIFTKLNTIKPQMITEAIKNAKDAAIQFTRESDTKLGKLRKANQGLFSIQDRDETFSSEEGFPRNGTSGVMKKVRVVLSVDYSIE